LRRIRIERHDGKRSRHRDAKSARVRLEELLDKGDTRGAVEAAKLLVREEPGGGIGVSRGPGDHSESARIVYGTAL